MVKRSNLLILLAAALALRVGMYFVFPPERYNYPDSQQYIALAANLTHGAGYAAPHPGMPGFPREPGFPLFLAALFSVFGYGFFAISVAQALLGMAVCYLTCRIADDLFGPMVAKYALIATAFHPVLIAYSNVILSEALFMFFITATVFFVVRAMRRSAVTDTVLSALGAGCACLTRPEVLPLAALLAVLIFAGIRPRLKALSLAGLFVLTFALAVVPWTAYRYRHSGSILSQHSGGIGLVVWGEAQLALPENRGKEAEVASRINAWYTKGVSPAENGQLLEEGIRSIAHYPLGYVKLISRRFAAYWMTSHSAIFLIDRPNAEYRAGKAYGILAVKTLLLLLQAVILFLTVSGIVLAARPDMRYLALVLMVAYSSGYTIVDYCSRHHVPYFPFMFIFAAYALVRLFGKRPLVEQGAKIV